MATKNVSKISDKLTKVSESFTVYMYDNERWGQYYRPWGVDAPTGSAPAPAAETAATPSPDAQPWEDEPAAVAPVVVPKATGGDKAADILALIRSRQTKTV